jgi:type I restriction enzyme S subunit
MNSLAATTFAKATVVKKNTKSAKDWPMVRLGDVCEFMRRGKSPIYCDISPYPMFAQKCNQPTHITLEKCKFCIPSKYLKFSEEYQLRENDIVVNSTGTGTLGRVGLFRMSYLEPYGYKSIVADSHVMIVRSAKIAFSVYVYWYMKQDWVYKWINDNANGSTNQKELYPQTLAQLSIPLPPLSVQNEIVAKLDVAKERCEKLKAEAERGLRASENLRKAILSEAFE